VGILSSQAMPLTAASHKDQTRCRSSAVGQIGRVIGFSKPTEDDASVEVLVEDEQSHETNEI
jgi:hypothetical protein